MHINQEKCDCPANHRPMSGVKHFWLSFLAVVTGVPAIIVVASSGFLFVGFLVLLMAFSGSSQTGQATQLRMTHVYGQQGSSNVLASIPIRGVIVSGTAADPLQSLFGQSYTDGEKVKEQLISLSHDPSVKGIILEIDSPGGMITASKAIADGIAEYEDRSSNPVIAHINGTGASGAYWVASSTDAISAEQGSEAGSIGVILGPIVSFKEIVSYGDVSTRVPMTFNYITAGRSKDIGSPYRDLTPDESAFLSQQLNQEYEKFVAHVSEARGIPAETIKNEIGALAYGTDDAIRLKLIDGEGSKEAAYKDLAARAQIIGGFAVERVESNSGIFGSLFGVKELIQGKMSAQDRSAGRARFCATNLIGKPLVLSGDVSEICR